jgi:hypothetical protein
VDAVTGNWQLSLLLLELLGLFVDFVRCLGEVMCRSSETYRRLRYYISTPQIAQIVTRNRDQIIPRRGGGGYKKSDFDFDSCLPSET